MVKVGLFDSFEKNRQKVFNNLANLFEFVKELGSLFGDTIYSWQESEDWMDQEKILHGTRASRSRSQPNIPYKLLQVRLFTRLSQLEICQKNSYAIILVEVQKIKVIRTKKGENMAFLQVDDSKKKIRCYPFFRFI